MAPKELTGIFVALVTPFTDDGENIDQTRLQAHIERLIKAGVHGLVPGGTTGEFTTMEIAERKELIDLCIKFADGRVPVVAGIGHTRTHDVVDLSIHAAKAGAAATMIVPPFFDPVNYEQLRELFSEVFQVSKLPIMYYNIPSASGLSLSPQEIAGLSEVGCTYLKDTSGNAPALTELIFGLSHKITAFNGWDTLTFYSLAAGAKGSVWGATNIIPELSVKLWDALAVKNNLQEGRELWKKIWPICAFLESHNYPSACKTGMLLQGHETGPLRKPFALLEGQPRAELARLLKNAGLNIVE